MRKVGVSKSLPYTAFYSTVAASCNTACEALSRTDSSKAAGIIQVSDSISAGEGPFYSGHRRWFAATHSHDSEPFHGTEVLPEVPIPDTSTKQNTKKHSTPLLCETSRSAPSLLAFFFTTFTLLSFRFDGKLFTIPGELVAVVGAIAVLSATARGWTNRRRLSTRTSDISCTLCARSGPVSLPDAMEALEATAKRWEKAISFTQLL